jgi:hypothetical protein
MLITKSVQNWIFNLHKFSRIFPHFLSNFLARKTVFRFIFESEKTCHVGPTCRSLSAAAGFLLVERGGGVLSRVHADKSTAPTRLVGTPSSPSVVSEAAHCPKPDSAGPSRAAAGGRLPPHQTAPGAVVACLHSAVVLLARTPL